MSRTIRALLLAGALTAAERPAVGQIAGGRPAPPPAAAGGAAMRSHGGRLSHDAAERNGEHRPGAAMRSHGGRLSASGERRDPFANPFRRGDPPAEKARPRGLAGIAVDELTLRGLVRIAGAYVAVLESGDGRTHLLRGGETLFDGSVRSVTAGGVAIVRRGRGGPAGAVRLALRAATEEER